MSDGQFNTAPHDPYRGLSAQFAQTNNPHAFGRVEAQANNPHLVAMAKEQQPPIPRALEAQERSLKHLSEAAHALSSRLGPVLLHEPSGVTAAGGGTGGSMAPAACSLSDAIDSRTAEVDAVALLLRATLRRLAI